MILQAIHESTEGGFSSYCTNKSWKLCRFIDLIINYVNWGIFPGFHSVNSQTLIPAPETFKYIRVSLTQFFGLTSEIELNCS